MKKILVLIFCMIFLLGTISALEFDNRKYFDEGIGEYGKIEIKDWFGLKKLTELTLEENTEICYGKCYANKTIIMYEDGVLIDDVSFHKIKGNGVKSYSFYIIQNNKWVEYTLGTEVSKGTYQVKLEGELYPFSHIDWIIESQGIWITEWAEWIDGLDTNLVAYYDLESLTANNGIDLLIGTASPVFNGTNCLSGNCSHLNGINQNLRLNNSNGDFNSSDVLGNLTWAGWIRPHNFDLTTYLFYQSGFIDTSITAVSGVINVQTLTESTKNSPSAPTINEWNFLVYTRNNTNTCLWLNNTLQFCDTNSSNFGNSAVNLSFGYGYSTGNANFTGEFDEWGFWERALTPDEINHLWNNGTGIMFTPSVSVTLNSPINYQNLTTTSVTFNCSASTRGNENIQNISLYLDGIRNYTKTHGTSNFTSLETTINNLEIKEYNWTCEAWTNVDTNNMASNRTLTIKDFVENSQVFNENTTESSLETFEVNISYDTSKFSNSFAYLIYNSTSYLGSRTISGNDILFTREIRVPSVDEKTNFTFYWEIILNNGTNNYYNSTFYNQSVSIFGLDNCSENSIIIYNFTMVDEKTQSKLIETDYNTSTNVNIEIYSLDRSSLFENYSTSFVETNSFSICINSSLSGGESYSVDGEIQYEADEYVSEFYHIQNTTLSNNSLYRNITLYDLDNQSSQNFKITYKDENFLAVEDALIQIQRKYVGEGVSKTIEIPKTDANGETLAHLEIDDAVYTFIIVKYGEVLSTFNDVIAQCQNPTLQTCEINFNSFSNSINPEVIESYSFLDYLKEIYNKFFKKITTTQDLVDVTPESQIECVGEGIDIKNRSIKVCEDG